MPGVQYHAPHGRSVTAAFAAHTAAPAAAVTAQFASDSRWQQAKTLGFADSAAGAPVAWRYLEFIGALGIGAPNAHPQPAARWVTAALPEHVAPSAGSVTAGAVYQGAPTVARFTAPSTQLVQADGAQTAAFGDLVIGNQTEWVAAEGFRASNLGDSRIRNQHEILAPAPIASPTPELGVYRAPFTAREVTAALPALRMHLSGDVTAQMLPPAVPRVEHRNAAVKARAFYGGEGGDPVVWNRNRYVWAGNLSSALAWGLPTVFNRDQYLAAKGFDAAVVGQAFAQGGVSELLVAPIEAPALTGQPWLSFSPRKLEPAGAYAEFRSTHSVGGTRWVEPDGYEATRWGERIIPAVQQVFPLGFDGAFGLARAWNYTTPVFPPGMRTYPQESDHWGFTRLHNSRQYIEQFPDPESGLSGERWSLWTKVENRNRTVATHSTAPSAPPRPFIWNKAAPVLPGGIAAPEAPAFYKAGMVAYRIRELPLEGLEPPHLSGWSRAYNKARVLQPDGLDAARYGRGLIESNRRRFPYISAGDMAATGTPMIADAIRTLVFEARYTIAPPPIDLPDVQLGQRFIEPASLYGVESGSGEVGGHFLHIHWNRFYPRWIHIDAFGWPALRNLTPELRTHGRNAEEFGETVVRTEWRVVDQQCPSTELWGRARIADRRQTVRLSGSNYLRFGDRMQVVRVGGLPNFTQYLYPFGFALNVADQVPKPSLQQQVLYVKSDEGQASYGMPVVTANSIRVEPGLQEHTVGEPYISQHTRHLYVRAWEEPQFSPIGKPVMSHLTVWAVVEAPEQAKRNHPAAQSPNYVNTGIELGAPEVSHRHRFIFPRWRPINVPQDPVVFGQAQLMNRKHYVRPTGLQAYRNGWQRVWGGVDWIEHEDAADAFISGHATVAHVEPWIRRLYPMGLSGVFGFGEVTHKHRRVTAVGYEATAMGSSRTPDSDYTRHSLHVGEPKPTIPEGFDAARFGDSWTSHKIRDVFVPGTDFFESSYDLQHFKERMKVWRRRDRVPSAGVATAGGDASGCGVPDVKLGAHYIRPDGNADQFRKGAF